MKTRRKKHEMREREQQIFEWNAKRARPLAASAGDGLCVGQTREKGLFTIDVYTVRTYVTL